MELIRTDLTIDFMGFRKITLGLSGLAILIGLLSIAMHGGLNYGVDFAGGTLVQLKFKNPPAIDQIRDSLKTINLSDSTIQEFGSKNDILIRVQMSDAKLESVGDHIRATLSQSLKTEDISVERVEMVGPQVGRDLREKALLAIIYANIGLLIYITWRFEFRYAVAAMLSLVHDTMITVGAFSVLNKEFTLVVIAAILTLIGYSLNDTIVVFDRIRENVRRKARSTLTDTINLSINQTLSRTVLTSGFTMLMVIALFFLGGETIHDFSFAMVIGIIIGTYSSIYIASVFLVYWEEWFKQKRA